MTARSHAAVRTPVRHTSIGPVLANPFHAGYGMVAKFVRVVLNRRVAAKLDNLTDHELSDIGLTRADLHFGRSVPLSADPTAELARRARQNALMSMRRTF